ncbi:MAG: AzlD domain-containing protein [Oscillospiraceae bacterium]|nr:AzlD domain-containing protein [Oscillospiraceae bacterium]
MNAAVYLKYLLVMAGVTYLIRMLPLVAADKKLTNRFLRSFLYYVPFAVLAAMTVPAAFYSTGSIFTAAAGFVVALALALCGGSLVTVALAACAAAFLVGLWL